MASPWRLVWCHERCHKEDMAVAREALSAAVSSSGGRLVVLKKQKQFSAWASRGQRPPYVLITGWREAKPCLRTLERALSPADCPVAAIVLCDQRKSKRAELLVAELDTTLPVTVRHSLGQPEALVREVVEVLQAARESRAGMAQSVTGSEDEGSSNVAPHGHGPQSPLAMLDPQQLTEHARYRLAQALQAAAPDHYED